MAKSKKVEKQQEATADEFTSAMLAISPAVFARMVMKSGLTSDDGRALCLVHKELRG